MIEMDYSPLDYHGMEILAPMVRAGTLPLRLECLRYGANLVYGEEIIDRKLIGVQRIENSAFGTVDFVSPRDKVPVFSTCAEERARVVFQLGSADSSLATQAALLVCQDVYGVDVNMGCPKSFSVKGGMGAALLSTPHIAADILKSLRRELPAKCVLTCKIRMLPTIQQTRDFMKLMEQCGVAAITVHMRSREERPRDPAHWKEIVQVCDAVDVPVIANGDFFSRRQIADFWEQTKSAIKRVQAPVDVCSAESDGTLCDSPASKGPAAIMIARGAMWNPSIFCKDEHAAPGYEDMLKSYVRSAVRVNSTYQNTKWVLNEMLTGGSVVIPPTEIMGSKLKDFRHKVGQSKSMETICGMFGEGYNAADFPERSHTTAFYRNYDFQVPGNEEDELSKPEEASTKRSIESPDEGIGIGKQVQPGAKRIKTDG